MNNASTNTQNLDPRLTQDLSMLVARLAHALKRSAPNNPLADQALEFLKRKGIAGSPLRETSEVWSSAELTCRLRELADGSNYDDLQELQSALHDLAQDCESGTFTFGTHKQDARTKRPDTSKMYCAEDERDWWRSYALELEERLAQPCSVGHTSTRPSSSSNEAGEFIEMIARFSTAEEVGEPDPEDTEATLDRLILKARKLTGAAPEDGANPQDGLTHEIDYAPSL